MIRRPAGQDFLLITQTDHARLSGFLAKHIGNKQFTAPSDEAVAAIAAHDAGWPLHDENPTLNPAGLPLHVFEMPPSWSTRIWTASAERAVEPGPYAALLVSLHQLALSALAERPRQAGPRDVFELNKFQHRQIERQEALRKQLGMRTDIPLTLGLAKPRIDVAEDTLRHHFRLLTLCDRLSLELCCGQPLFERVEEVPPSPTVDAISIQMDLRNSTTLNLSPWPFDNEVLSSEIPFRRIPATPFSSEDAFRAAYGAAEPESLRLELRRVG